MLRVTAILEGGLDLEKGEEIPRSIVVTNGKRVVTIPVPDAKVQDLISMFAEELGKTVERPPHLEPQEPKVFTKPTFKRETKPLFEMEPAEPETHILDEDSQDFKPGEDYDDPGTGVSSL
jgi:hypothetical protein